MATRIRVLLKLMALSKGASGERRVLFTGGGTGGHVYPGLAVLDYLHRKVPRLVAQWVGSERIESKLVRDAGIDFHQIDIRFSYRRLTLANLGYYRDHLLPLVLGKPFRQAAFALESFRPDIVVGTGGYVSAPALWAAQQVGIPYALIQLDCPPGLVNWTMADKAWRIYASTNQVVRGFLGRCAQEKVVRVGYPAIPGKCSRAKVEENLGIEPNRKIMLCVGGSLGAGAINALAEQTLAAAKMSHDKQWDGLAVVHVGGTQSLGAGGAGLVRGPVQYIHKDYIDNMGSLINCCDFYLGRSGAATVGELVAAGLHCLLIPDPQHVDAQQTFNAFELVRGGQGAILAQRDASGYDVIDWLRSVWDKPRVKPPMIPPADEIADDMLAIWDNQ